MPANDDDAPVPKVSKTKKAKVEKKVKPESDDEDAPTARGPPPKVAKGNGDKLNQPSKVATNEVPAKSKRGRKKGEEVADDSAEKYVCC